MDNDAGMREIAQAARASKAPVNTAYSLEPRQTPPNETNVKGRPGNFAISNDVNESFASELNKVPVGQINMAQNLLNKAIHDAKTTKDREAVEKTWRAHVATYGKRK